MNRTRSWAGGLIAGFAVAGVLTALQAAQQTPPAKARTLRVGAARIDITPIPPEGNRIRDRLYASAIVIDNGAARAVLIGADQISFGEQVWADVTKRIAAEFQIPPEQVLTTATHTHSDGRFGVAPPTGGAGRGAAPPTGGPGRAGAPTAPPAGGRPAGGASSTVLSDATLEAVRRAIARLQPARVGYGAGQSHLNVNRERRRRGRRLDAGCAGRSEPSVLAGRKRAGCRPPRRKA